MQIFTAGFYLTVIGVLQRSNAMRRWHAGNASQVLDLSPRLNRRWRPAKLSRATPHWHSLVSGCLEMWFLRRILEHFHAVPDLLFGFIDAGPALNPHPFAFVQVLVMFKEVGNLVEDRG